MRPISTTTTILGSSRETALFYCWTAYRKSAAPRRGLRVDIGAHTTNTPPPGGSLFFFSLRRMLIHHAPYQTQRKRERKTAKVEKQFPQLGESIPMAAAAASECFAPLFNQLMQMTTARVVSIRPWPSSSLFVVYPFRPRCKKDFPLFIVGGRANKSSGRSRWKLLGRRI